MVTSTQPTSCSAEHAAAKILTQSDLSSAPSSGEEPDREPSLNRSGWQGCELRTKSTWADISASSDEESCSLGNSDDPGSFNLTAAARAFSTQAVPRQVMESSGHVSPSEADNAARKAVRPAVPLPPPLTEVDLPDLDGASPGTPEWSPKNYGSSGWPLVSPQPQLHGRPTPAPLQSPHFAPQMGWPQQSPHQPPVGWPQLSPQRSTLKPALYRVAFLGGVDLRRGPSFGALRTGVTLRHNEVFVTSEEIPGPDGRIYLRLADGRGWAFDDRALIPHDPSVARGHWAPVAESPMAMTPMAPVTPAAPVSSAGWEPAAEDFPSSVTSAPSAGLWQPCAEPTTPPCGWGEAEEGETTRKTRRRRKRGGRKRRSKDVASEEGESTGAAAWDED